MYERNSKKIFFFVVPELPVFLIIFKNKSYGNTYRTNLCLLSFVFPKGMIEFPKESNQKLSGGIREKRSTSAAFETLMIITEKLPFIAASLYFLILKGQHPAQAQT
jgi:hypothetical protein